MTRLLPVLLFLLPALAHAQPPARTGKDYAVFFYVTHFKSGWNDLPETEKEADAIKKTLETDYNFSTERIANPTKAQMRAKIREYSKKLTPADQALFFFSTHGHYDTDGDRGYLVGIDGESTDPFGDSWYSYDELRADLGPCKAKHILLALDACHSGAFGTRTKSGPDAPVYDDEDCLTQVNKTLAYTGRQYCASGNKDAKTPARSLFAMQFLEALRSGGDGKTVQMRDVAYFLEKIETPKPVTGYFGAHEAGGDFVFVRKNACAPAVVTLDRDGDGVPDADDKCPDAYGPPARNGCPDTGNLTTDTDTDYDGLPDKRDGCPTEYGTAKANGCPDRDNDGVPDKSDKCADKAGQPNWQGCPDSDGDGLPDHEDACPGQKGLAADNGCPPPDRDADGVPDKADKCPDKAGLANLQGCPEAAPEDPLSLVLVTGGTYMMGCTNEQQDCEDDEKPAHKVTVSDFYIGRFEVTQQLWTEIMGNNPSYFKDCAQCPVEQVSWNDVQDFLKKLNAKYPGRNYRLPTEAEWEYAARGGGKAVLFGNGKNVADPAEINFDGSSTYKKSYSVAGVYRQKTIPVGSLNSPNALGLHDMSGNVWEWCSDWYGSYPKDAQNDPQGPTESSFRVYRGGSWNDTPANARVSSRNFWYPGYRNYVLGFRLARTP